MSSKDLSSTFNYIFSHYDFILFSYTTVSFFSSFYDLHYDYVFSRFSISSLNLIFFVYLPLDIDLNFFNDTPSTSLLLFMFSTYYFSSISILFAVLYDVPINISDSRIYPSSSRSFIDLTFFSFSFSFYSV